MNKLLLLAGCGVAAGFASGAGVPQVSDVWWSQASDTRAVTIRYKLDMPAVVTMDVLTNGVSIGMQHVSPGLSGAVHRLVEDDGTGQNHVITWEKPYESWLAEATRHSNATVRVTAWATNAPPDWLVIDLTAPQSVAYYETTNAFPVAFGDDLYRTTHLVMRKIPAKFRRWRMGECYVNESSAYDNWYLRVSRYVTLTKDFYMGVYPVTQRQYELVTGQRPSRFSLDSCYQVRPVDGVSYTALRGSTKGAGWPNADPAVAHDVDSSSAIYQFRELTGLGMYLDLPTEAQWEFACRAGTTSGLYTGVDAVDSAAVLNPIARTIKNSGATNNQVPSDAATADTNKYTAAVGMYQPNAWSLYDLYGNVREWCLDWDYATQADVPGDDAVDPVGPSTGSNRLKRGGANCDGFKQCRSAYRGRQAPATSYFTDGFRLCLTLDR